MTNDEYYTVIFSHSPYLSLCLPSAESGVYMIYIVIEKLARCKSYTFVKNDTRQNDESFSC